MLGVIIFAIVVVGTLALLKPIQPDTSPQPQFYMSYYFTTEATYEKIEMNQSKLIYVYFPKEIAEEKCARWLQQAACWTEKDLRTKETTLTATEINDLIHLIDQTNFMSLESTYGGAEQYQRYYPYSLFVKIGEKEKEVIYQSFPDASPMPKAFEVIKDKLLELMNKKFSI